MKGKLKPSSQMATILHHLPYIHMLQPTQEISEHIILLIMLNKSTSLQTPLTCEVIPRQVNFLADEAGDCGKGSNTVISLLHYYFENHGLGEKEVFLHVDNCTGQNKNNAMLQYLAWRVMTGRHTQITLSFLVVGHTIFAPDCCFGLFK